MRDLHRLYKHFTSSVASAIGAVKKRQISGRMSPLYIAGSLTVEAAMAFPLCLGALLLLTGLLSAARTSEQIDHYLCMTARQLAAYSEAKDGVTALDAYRFFYADLGSSGIDFDSISGGKAGILLTLPQKGGDEGLICLKASCRIRVPGYIMGDRGIRITDQVITRGWIGAADTDTNEVTYAEYVPVFVAESGVVYHKNRGCTYLDLDIRTVSAANARLIRNQYGEKYHACAFCGGGGSSGKYYVTGMGNAWHTDPHCGGLTRHLHTMDEQEALDSGLRPCSRCGR